MMIIAIIFAVMALYAVWQYLELQKFRITKYEIETDKVQEGVRLAVIADLHCHEYGKGNKRLLAAIRKAAPDAVMIPGDMIVGAHIENYDIAFNFLKEVSQIAPVYLSNGNHESRVEKKDSRYFYEYSRYRQALEHIGIHILNNHREAVCLKKNDCMVYGVDIPLQCYEKGKKNPLPDRFLLEKFGECEEEQYTILLAHNPAYCDNYAAWGADLILSGHMHGGLIRIPGIGSLISPQFELFPKYDAGRFQIGKSTAIVSKGLGTHTFHIRVFNRAELILLSIKTIKNH